MKNFLVRNLPAYLVISILIATTLISTHSLGLNNYGYDYGFYSYAVQHTPLDSPAYFVGLTNDYGNHLFVLLNWLRLPQVPSLEITFILFFVISGIILYHILKRLGWVTTTAGLLLFTFSIAQNQLYTMFIWKAAYGQMLLLFVFLLIQLRLQFFWELIPLLVLIITHKTTSLITFVSLAPHYLLTNIKHKLMVIVAITIAGLIFLFGLHALDYFKELQNSGIRNGLFLEVGQYLKYSWFLVLLGSYGIFKSVKTKTNLTWLGLLGISLLFIIFKIAFFQRVILYADLSLVFFSAFTIHLLKSKPKLQITLLCIAAILAITSYVSFTKTIRPQITETEITEIQTFSKAHQGAFILALSAQDGPWLLANLSGNNRLAAPGLFEDKYSKNQWEAFWLSPENQSFLNNYPKPLYIYQRSTIFYPTGWDCLNKTSQNFFEYICHK